MPDDLILAIKARVPSPPLPPLTEAGIADAEAQLGFALPDLLRDLYMQVGNGRFGPGHGFLSLQDLGDNDLYLVETYVGMRKPDREDPMWKWPFGVVPFCNWGCNMYSCVDCANPPYRVLTYECVEGRMRQSFFPTRDSLEAWLRDWLAGESVFESVFEPAPELDWVGTNPATKEPMVIKGRKPRRR